MKRLGYIVISSFVIFNAISADERDKDKTFNALDKNTYKNDAIKNSYTKSDEELLKLLLTTFLGKSDLENAYNIVKKAVELFPNSEYWWQWYSKISIWTGRREEAFLAAEKLASLNPSKDNLTALFQISLATNRFDVASSLIFKYKNLAEQIKDIKDLVYIFEQSGNIEELKKLLLYKYENEKNTDYLFYMALVNYNYGDLEEALKYIRELERLKELNLAHINLYANILYGLKRYQELFDMLKKYINYVNSINVDKNTLNSLVEYYRNLSDIGWFMGDYNVAIYASGKLYNLQNARLVDYIRLSIYYLYKRDYKIALLFSKKGYEEYKDGYLLILYIESLQHNNSWKDLYILFSSLDRDVILKNDYIVSVYIKTLINTGKTKQAKEFVKNILRENFSENILSEAIYVSIELSDPELANFIKDNYTDYEKKLKKQFALLYSFLQNSEKALLLISDSLNKEDYDELLFYADILYSNGREEESRRIKFDIYRNLLKDINLVYQDAKKLELFIRAGFEFLPDEHIKRYLDLARSMLDKKIYEDLYYSYLFHLLNIDKHDKLNHLINTYGSSLRPWMYLNLALWMDDRYLQQDLLEKFKDILPIRDRVESLRNTGNINQAFYYAHKGLEENRNDYNLYKQYRDLVYNYGSKMESISSLTSWDNVSSFKEEFLILYNLTKGLYINYQSTNFFTLKNSNIAYKSLGSNIFNVIKLKKLLDDGYFETGISLLGDTKKSGFTFRYNRYIEDKTSMNLDILLNGLSYESLYMLYGGMKDSYSISLTHSFNDRLSVLLSSIFEIYKSRDGIKVGDSLSFYGESFYKLRIGYPDYTFRLYMQNSNFNEKDTDKGSINKISNYQNPDVLPQSYSSIGLGFLFGFDNRDNYVRVWRPFFSSDIILNNRTGLGFGLSAGIRGTLFRQDNLSTGFRYIKDFKGTTTSFWEYFLKYLLFF